MTEICLEINYISREKRVTGFMHKMDKSFIISIFSLLANFVAELWKERRAEGHCAAGSYARGEKS